MNARLTTLLAAAIAIALIAAGCGGGGDSTSTGGSAASGGGEAAGGGESIATSSLSKEEFIKQGTAACEQKRENLVEDISAYVNRRIKEGAPEKAVILAMAKTVFAPTVKAEIDALRALGAPEGEEDEVEAILVAEEKGIDEVNALKSADNLEQIEDRFVPATKLFKAYGFEGCTNSP